MEIREIRAVRFNRKTREYDTSKRQLRPDYESSCRTTTDEEEEEEEEDWTVGIDPIEPTKGRKPDEEDPDAEGGPMGTMKTVPPTQLLAGTSRGQKRSPVNQGRNTGKGQKTRQGLMDITNLITHMSTRQEIHVWPALTRSGKTHQEMAGRPPRTKATAGKTKQHGNKSMPTASMAPVPLASSRGAGTSRGKPQVTETPQEELYEDAALDEEERQDSTDDPEGTTVYYIEILVLKITKSLQDTSPDEAIEGGLVNMTSTEARKHESWKETTEDIKLNSDENMWMLPTTQIRLDQDRSKHNEEEVKTLACQYLKGATNLVTSPEKMKILPTNYFN